jgi:hypothetical protein
LYTPSNLQMLRDDFARIPELLALDPPPQPEPAIEHEIEVVEVVEVETEPVASAATASEPTPPADPGAAQLGLF